MEAMNRTASTIGFWAALSAFFFIISYCAIQLLQVARLLFFPWDEILIYGTSLGIVIPFLLAILALHYMAPAGKKIWTHAALLFAILYSVFVTANYTVQLATVIPAKVNGSATDLHILEQTPHSLLWDFDALGYVFMGLTTLAAIPVFNKQGFQKWVRVAFLANALVTPLISVVYFYPVYSEKLLLLGYPWAITAPAAMLLLALLFKKCSVAQHSTNGYKTKQIIAT